VPERRKNRSKKHTICAKRKPPGATYSSSGWRPAGVSRARAPHPLSGHQPGRTDLEAIAVSLEEVLHEDYLQYRIASTAYLGRHIADHGVRVLRHFTARFPPAACIVSVQVKMAAV
jgi:hypothetical protein